MLFVINLPPTLRTETDGLKPMLTIAGDAVVPVVGVVNPGMQLAHIGRPQPLPVGLGAGVARRTRSDGESGEAGDGGPEGMFMPFLVSCLSHLANRKRGASSAGR